MTAPKLTPPTAHRTDDGKWFIKTYNPERFYWPSAEMQKAIQEAENPAAKALEMYSDPRFAGLWVEK